MLTETHLKELRDKEGDIAVISFEGDVLDIYELRDYARIINSVQREVDEEYYRGFKKKDDCEDSYGKGDEEMNKVVSAEQEEDLVNNPNHYANNGAMECIDEMILLYGEEAVMNFCLCNMHKYRYRANMKGGELDKKKSDWYVAKYGELKDIVDKQKYDKYKTFMNDMMSLLGTGAALCIDEPGFERLYERFAIQ